jgi:hypothetical protein
LQITALMLHQCCVLIVLAVAIALALSHWPLRCQSLWLPQPPALPPRLRWMCSSLALICFKAAVALPLSLGRSRVFLCWSVCAVLFWSSVPFARTPLIP